MDLGKRKHEEIEVEELPDKRAKVEITTNLLDLSDDVLLCIIRLLNSFELINLSEVCTRFGKFIPFFKVQCTIIQLLKSKQIV